MMKVEIDGVMAALLNSLSEKTTLSPSEIVRRVLGGQVGDLCELDNYIDRCVGDAAALEEGRNLLISYGPETLTQGIKRINPEYQTAEDEFVRILQRRGGTEGSDR